MINCSFENGRAANLRHAVVDAVIIKDNKILLTKRAPSLRAGGKWAIPGGYIERDETTLEAVMREVLEETGYSCAVDQLFTVLDSPTRRGDDRQNISFVFTAQLIEQINTELDQAEVTELRWFDLAALPAASDMAFDHLEIIWEWIKQNDPTLAEPPPLSHHSSL